MPVFYLNGLVLFRGDPAKSLGRRFFQGLGQNLLFKLVDRLPPIDCRKDFPNPGDDAPFPRVEGQDMQLDSKALRTDQNQNRRLPELAGKHLVLLPLMQPRPRFRASQFQFRTLFSHHRYPNCMTLTDAPEAPAASAAMHHSAISLPME